MKAGRIIFVLMLAFVAAVPLSAYVTAYVALGEYDDHRAFPRVREEPNLWNHVERCYGQRPWCVALFGPAAALESKWIGCPVYLTYEGDPPNTDTGLMPP